jgi:hypothetical protein
MPQKIKDIDVTVSKVSIKVFDNADSSISSPKLDRLAQLSTGALAVYRALYMDDREVRHRSDAFISLTAIRPSFNRPDIANRAIRFQLQDPNKRTGSERFTRDGAVADVMEENRIPILRELYHRVHRFVESRPHENMVDTTYTRLTDFEAVARHLELSEAGDDREMVKIFRDKLSLSQNEFVLLDDPLVGLLDEWLETDSHIGEPVTGDDLHAAFSLIEKDRQTKKPVTGEKKSFKHRFASTAKMLPPSYGATIQRGRKITYTFSPKVDTDE